MVRFQFYRVLKGTPILETSNTVLEVEFYSEQHILQTESEIILLSNECSMKFFAWLSWIQKLDSFIQLVPRNWKIIFQQNRTQPYSASVLKIRNRNCLHMTRNGVHCRRDQEWFTLDQEWYTWDRHSVHRIRNGSQWIRNGIHVIRNGKNGIIYLVRNVICEF